MRTLADIATGLRLVIAAYIVYAGLNLGPDSFAGVAAVTLVGWTLDTVDGHLARAATDSQSSWVGKHDRHIDTIMVVAGFLYVTLIGVIPVWVCVAYLMVSALLVLFSRSIAMLTALEAPLVALIPVLAFWLAPLWGWIFVTWSIVAAILDRRRLGVRLRILWDDLQRVRSAADNGQTERPQASESGADRTVG
jgi:hypothetical protein